MRSIHFKEVIVPEERQRKEFDARALEELATSLQKPHGQLQPIVLRNDERTLVAGERRLRAMELVKKPFTHDGAQLLDGHIAFVTLGELTAEQLFEAELEENVQRKDLTWQERARAIAALHDLRTKQNPDRTAKETAIEVYGDKASGRKQQEVANAIALSKYLDDPLVAAAPDEKTARKAIKQQLEHEKRMQAVATYNEENAFHKLFLGSCYELEIPENFFDVVVTDPPYGIDIHEKETFDDDAHEYDDSDDAFQEVLDKLPPLAHRACKPNAHLYCFCDIRRFTELFVAFEVGGWTVWPRPIIWDKGNIGSYGNIEYGFRACYDAILFARKGDRKVTAGFRDVININQQTGHKHPAGKPIELYKELIKRSAYPGDRIVDFYCGGGPIFQAATDQQCVAYGYELSEKYHTLAQEARMKAEGQE